MFDIPQTLMDMVHAVETDNSIMGEAAKLSDGERKEKLNLMSIQRKKLKDRSKQFLSSQPPENTMSEVGNFLNPFEPNVC